MVPHRDDWYLKAFAVQEASYPRGKAGIAARRSSLGAAFRNFWLRQGERVERWDEAQQVALADHYAKGYLQSEPFASYHAHHIKCIRLGYALAADDPAAAAPAERAWLVEAGLADATFLRALGEAAPTVAEGPSFHVPFGFHHEHVPGGARARRVPARATATVRIDRVGSGEAPVAWRLGFADGRGAVEVREHDGAFYRPVLAPGTSRPITEVEFAAAARGDDAWADSPFLPRDHQTPQPLTSFARRPAKDGPGDSYAREAASSACLARCGRLVSVDGVVHRRTAPPVVHLVVQHRRLDGEVVSLQWSLTGLASTSERHAVAALDTRQEDWSCGIAYTGRDAEAPEYGFPVAALAHAGAVAEELGRLGVDVVDGACVVPVNARFDEESQVAAAATTTRDALLKRAATFARCPSSAAFLDAVEASTLGEVEATRELTDVMLTWIDHPDLGDKYVAALLRATSRAVERGIRDEDEATLSFAP